MDNIPHIRDKIIEIAQCVYNQLGSGHSEYIYHRAMEIEFINNSIVFETEKRIVVQYMDSTGRVCSIGEERIDLFVNNCIIVELKVMRNSPRTNELIQVSKYYRQMRDHLPLQLASFAIIINFPNRLNSDDCGPIDVAYWNV